MADSDDDNFVMPAENATSAELRTALKQAQLTIGHLDAEIKELRLLNAALTGKKRNKNVRVDIHGYGDVIKDLGKKYGLMNDIWVHAGFFTARPAAGAPPHETKKDVEELFADPQLFTWYSTMQLYEFIPAKFHNIVDAAVVPDFASQFVSFSGAGRSTALGTIKAVLPAILKDLNIVKSTKELLYHSSERTGGPPSAYPPVLYRNLERKPINMYWCKVLPLVLRSLLFGKTSAGQSGKAKAQKGTLGYLWQLNTVTIPSICFTIVGVMFALDGSDPSWDPVGNTSKIQYRAIYRKHQELLMSNWDGVKRKIIPYWNGIVFDGVETVQAVVGSDGNVLLDEDIAGGFANAMGDLHVDDNMNHSYEGFDEIWNGNPASSVNNDSDKEDIVDPPVGFEEEQVEDKEEQIEDEDEDEIDAPVRVPAKRARPRRVEFVVSDSEPDDDIVQARPQGKGNTRQPAKAKQPAPKAPPCKVPGPATAPSDQDAPSDLSDLPDEVPEEVAPQKATGRARRITPDNFSGHVSLTQGALLLCPTAVLRSWKATLSHLATTNQGLQNFKPPRHIVSHDGTSSEHQEYGRKGCFQN
ncbi:hypothetical protein C8F01DRAFT_1370846 [Mycena amicta]|nr:hypothetical protein C8F01DRAFT_1370846 [Mycena amicta]